jgi:hypothetical protein
MESNNTSFSAILSSLEALEKSSGYNVFIPTQNTEQQFKVLTTEQLKELLKTVIDTPIYNTQFVLTFNKIIKDNCFDSSVYSGLNSYDKLFIFLKTRIENISDEYTITFTDEEKRQNNLEENIKTTILISDVYKHLNENVKTFTQESFTHEQCTVTCNVPQLETENKLEKEFHKTTKLNVDTPEELREIVGNTFINEITKYIISVQINEQVIDFASLTFKNRTKIVEKLPANVIKNVLKYIETYKQHIADVLKVKVRVQNKEQKEVIIEKELPYDASFFNT